MAEVSDDEYGGYSPMRVISEVSTLRSKLKNKIVYEDNEIYDAGASCWGPAYILHWRCWCYRLFDWNQLGNVAQEDPDKAFSAAVAGMYTDMQQYSWRQYESQLFRSRVLIT